MNSPKVVFTASVPVRVLLMIAAVIGIVAVVWLPMLAFAQTATSTVADPEAGLLTQVFAGGLDMLSTAVLAVLAWVAKKIADLINAQVKSKSMADALVRLDYAAINSVKYIEQTAVARIRQAKDPASPGGTAITASEAADIKAEAVAAAKSFLGMRGINEVLAVLGIGESRLDQILGQRIEGAVHDMKASKQRPPQ